MRTYEEIEADIRQAADTSDAQALLRLAAELDGIGSTQADAEASNARGMAVNFTGDYPMALEHFSQASALYEELGDRAGIARVVVNIGLVHFDTGNYPAALEHYRRALNLYEVTSDRNGVAHSTSYIGNVYVRMGDYGTALVHYCRALALHENIGDRAGIARVTANMGTVYIGTGDYPAALEHYRRALVLHEELDDRAGVALVTSNMGNVYLKTGDYPTALEHYRRALVLHEELDDRAGVALVTSNMGNVYLKTGDYPTALEHYRRALALQEGLGNRDLLATVTGYIASALLALERNEEAAHLLDGQALMVMDDPTVLSEYHANRAKLYERSNDLDAAKEHLLQALAVVTEVGARSEMAEVQKRLRDLAQKRNDFAAYIEHNNEYTRITEEIRGREATQKLAMMEAERRIEAERRQREKERALLYGALPKSVADRMIRGEKITGDHYDSASVIFLDIVGFTTISDRIPPGHVVHLLSQIFSTLDEVCKGHCVTKIKTIGDSYMAVAGVPEAHDDHALRAAQCALDMLAALNTLEITMPPELGDTSWVKNVGEIQVRIGIHCGPVTAGVIGTERLQYDVWGDTVNVASRMESTSEPGRIQVSEAFANALGCGVIPRGDVEIKGKGSMNTYWLITATEHT
jgi:class 3 adenylate cyclase/Tfp pilus assembly protein PilF